MSNIASNELTKKISSLLKIARQKVIREVNQTMVMTYFEIGHLIVEEEQKGKDRAEYGAELIKDLSRKLTKEFGKGFSETNLKQMRQFYQVYSNRQTVTDQFGKSQTLSDQSQKQQTASVKFNLSWSHYLKLMRIDDENERLFYEIEAYENSWSVRELNRQFDTALYTRLALSKDKKGVLELSEKGQIIEKPQDAIKDPYILEFIGLPENKKYSESELEERLTDKLEYFLLELGKARQKRISFEEKHFRIDLVFYNRILKSFVLIDLKIGELKHQDIGQMQMYVNYYDREVKLKEENKTIGIILCQDKSEAIVRYTLPEENEQIFASKYLTVLPSKTELKNLLNIDNKE